MAKPFAHGFVLWPFQHADLASGSSEVVETVRQKPIGPNNELPRLLAKESDKQGNKVHA